MRLKLVIAIVSAAIAIGLFYVWRLLDSPAQASWTTTPAPEMPKASPPHSPDASSPSAKQLTATNSGNTPQANDRKDAERVEAFRRFTDRVDRYARESGRLSESEKRARGEEIIKELQLHVDNGEMRVPEAALIEVKLIQDTESDPAVRDARSRAAKDRWERYAAQRVGPFPTQNATYRAFQVRSNQIIDQAMKEENDPAHRQKLIESRLESLRQETYK